MTPRIMASTLLFIGVLAGAGLAQSQGHNVLVFELRLDGDEISDAVVDRFRDALVTNLITGRHTILAGSMAVSRLGDDADRLLACTAEAPDCLIEAGEAVDAHMGIIAEVSKSGEIYNFTVDVYQLSDGSGLYYSDNDCTFCTVDEAADVLSDLAADASGALLAGGEPEPTTVNVIIEVEPNDATILFDGVEVGQGSATLSVEPGPHNIMVYRDGYQAAEDDVTIDGDRRIAVSLEAVGGGDDVASSSGRRSGGAFDEIDTMVWGSVFVGTGTVGMITGIVLLAIDGDTTCSEGAVAACANVYNTFGGGLTLTILGTASLSTGVIMLLWDTLAGDATDRSTSGSAAQIGVGMSPQSGWLSVGFDF